MNTNFIKLFVFGLVVVVTTATGNGQTQRQLLTEPEKGFSLSVLRPRHAINLDYAIVEFELLSTLQVDDKFEISIFDEIYQAQVLSIQPQIHGRSLRGVLNGQLENTFTLTIVDDAVAGTFFVPGRTSMIRLRYGGPKGLHYLHEVSLGDKDDCVLHRLGQLGERQHALGVPIRNAMQANSSRVDPLAALRASRFSPLLFDDDLESPPPGGSPLPGSCVPTPIFDIMLVYTDCARETIGSTAAMQAECVNAVELTELTYANCGLGIRTNLVEMYEVDYIESGNDYEDHLDALADDGDDILDFIHGDRISTAADLVSLIVADTDGAGLGYCDSSFSTAFSVCRWDVVADNLTLAHEIGHNLGCGHDRVTGDDCGFDNGFGNFFFVPGLDQWVHTVMSYRQNESSRIPFYSSPNCQFMGITTGTATENNLAVIDSRKGAIEGFLNSRMDVWVDFNFAGPNIGTFIFPYDSLQAGVLRIHPDPVVDYPVLNLKASSSPETLTIDKKMIITSCGGTATIGL